MTGIEQHNILILGDKGVGKKSIATQICSHQFPYIWDSTENGTQRVLRKADGQSHVVDLHYVSGDSEYSAMRDQLVADANAIILVYSISNRSSFLSLSHTHNRILGARTNAAARNSLQAKMSKSLIEPQDPELLPICMAGNKSDLESDREIPFQDGQSLANGLKMDSFVEVSATNYEQCDALIANVLQTIMTREELLRSSVIENKKGEPSQSWYRKIIQNWRKVLPTRRSQELVFRQEADSEVAYKIRLQLCLVEAIKSNSIQILETCLSSDADPNLPTTEGTPLQIAAAAGSSMAVKILAERGANLQVGHSIPLAKRKPLLQIAAEEGHIEAVKVLLEKGVDINEEFFRSTALGIAMRKGHMDIVRFLYENGAQSSLLTRREVEELL